jgi:hypothetical protein
MTKEGFMETFFRLARSKGISILFMIAKALRVLAIVAALMLAAYAILKGTCSVMNAPADRWMNHGYAPKIGP